MSSLIYYWTDAWQHGIHFVNDIFIIICFWFSYSSDDPDILEWDEKSWRDADWVEQAKCKQALGWNDSEDPAEFIYIENPDLQQYRWVGHDPSSVSHMKYTQWCWCK